MYATPFTQKIRVRKSRTSQVRDLSKSEIDYILVRRKERSVVKDVTTISGEACATQHKLLLCKIDLSQSVPKKKKERPIDRCRLWKLKLKETSAEYCEEVRLKAEERSEGNVDSVWKEFSECLTTAANKICGRSRRKLKKRDMVVE